MLIILALLLIMARRMTSTKRFSLFKKVVVFLTLFFLSLIAVSDTHEDTSPSEDDQQNFQLTTALASTLSQEVNEKCDMLISEPDIIKNSPLFRKLLVGIAMGVWDDPEKYFETALHEMDCPISASGRDLLP